MGNIFDDGKFLCKGVILVIIVGIAMRLFLGWILEYNNDITAWTMTICNLQAGGDLYSMAGYYYTPVWGYMLATFGEFMGLIGVDTWAQVFTELLYTEDLTDEAAVTTVGFNMALTVFYLVGDILGAFAVYWLVKRVTGDMRKAKIGFAIYFLAIHLAMVGAVWGQFDTFSALMAILCICLLVRGNHFLAGMMFSAACLLKVFPAALILVLIIYIYRKGGDQWVRQLLMSIAGAAIMAGMLMLPLIMDGNVMDSMTFLTARAEGGSGDMSDLILKYSMLTIYPILGVFELILAWYYLKRYRCEDEDKGLLWFSLLAMLVLFLYPSTPQYILLLLPFVVVGMMVFDMQKAMAKPFILMVVGNVILMLTCLSMTTVTNVFYMGMISFEDWQALDEFVRESMIFGFSISRVLSVVGSAIQTAGVAWMTLVALDSMGTFEWVRERKQRKAAAQQD
ncbi:MAG: DUF2029 domain-containing protein [Candidatus Methanomethylophilaceae archaeon]|nr:DUF2029 domain-containing protein [Candidatus Methanomethylophilaceae archaeon]